MNTTLRKGHAAGRTLALLAAAAACSAAAFAAEADGARKGAASRWPRLEEVIVARKCHLDVGFTHSVPDLKERYATIYMDRAFEMFESDRHLPKDLRSRWTVATWAVDTALAYPQPAWRMAKLEDALRSRRLMYHAFPFTVEAENADLEELVRCFSYANGVSRRFGLDLPRYAKQTDVPEQSWAMATLMANAGVKFLFIGINTGSKPYGELDKIPPLCWWEGPDGKRVLLAYSNAYGWDSTTPPEGWKHKTWLAFFVGDDNMGPGTGRPVEKILEDVREKLPAGVRVRFGDPADFATAIIEEERENPTLPVVRGDMPDTWIHGVMSAPEASGMHRRAAGALITLGQLDTTMRAFGIDTAPAGGALGEAYREECLYAEHTWGASTWQIKHRIFQPDWRKYLDKGEWHELEDRFQYHMDYARRALKAADAGIAGRMKKLAAQTNVEGARVTVFNPLPWRTDAAVRVDAPQGTTAPGATRLADGRLELVAKNLPPGGYATIPLSRGDAPGPQTLPNATEFETRHFKVRFDLDKGGLSSLVEKKSGRELVRRGGRVLGQFVHEKFSTNEVARFQNAYNRHWAKDRFSDFGKGYMPGPDKAPYAALTPGNWTMKRERTAAGETVVLTAGDTLGLAKKFTLRFSFPDWRECVDIEWTVEDKTPDPIPEGGWICLPFNVANPAFRAGRLGGTIDPAKDIIFGGNRNLMCIDRAITVREGDGGAGVAAASADLPLWSMGKPGLWRYEPQYAPEEPELFANLYNNMWDTNFQLWIRGTWSASLRIWPVAAGAGEEEAMFTPAWEVRQPCVAAFADGPAGALAAAKEGVAVSRKGVRVTAFCPNPDGAGTLLRVWEQSGKGGPLEVRLPEGMSAAWARPINLRGESAGAPVRVENGTLSFELGAWAPASFVFDD